MSAKAMTSLTAGSPGNVVKFCPHNQQEASLTWHLKDSQNYVLQKISSKSNEFFGFRFRHRKMLRNPC